MTPTFTITVNGQDLTGRFSGVSRISLVDRRGFLADTLSISVADPTGEMELPEQDAEIRIALGFEGQPLEDKGLFVVDNVGFETPSDTINISARSANIKKSWNISKSRSFQGTTLGGMLEKIAGGQKVSLEVNSELATIPIEHMDQTNESDGHFLTRLGALYGALATVKDGRLVFMPLSRGTTAAGSPIPTMTLARSDGDRLTFNNRKRASEFGRVKARYHDLAAGETKAVTVSAKTAEGDKLKTLPGTFPDEAQARAAAEGKLRRLSDEGAGSELVLAVGNPAIITETPVKLQGYRERIDGFDWVVAQVKHTFAGDGLSTTLDLVPKIN